MPKIAFIGAGSMEFAKKLLSDIFSFPSLQNSEIALMDVDESRLSVTKRTGEAMIEQNNLNAEIYATTERQRALEDADYVLNMIHVGGKEPFENEIRIPEKYGVKQAVGDTLGPGGVFRAQRTIPLLLDVARDMEAYCPNAPLLNYTNPMAMVCWAVDEETDITILGLCHSVQRTANALASYADVPTNEVEYWVAGINHLAWFLEISANGEDLYPTLRDAMEDSSIYDRDNVRFEMMRHFGTFVTESSHHVSEYLPYFRTDQEQIDALTVENPEFDRVRWMPTGGYLDHWLSNQSEEDIELADEDYGLTRSEEYGSRIIHSLETGEVRRMNINVRNTNGTIENLPSEACVEVPCLVDGTGVHACTVGRLPSELAALDRTNINVQELAVRAALEKDRDALYRAVKLDPLTGASLSLSEIDSMVAELLEANADYLPKYS